MIKQPDRVLSIAVPTTHETLKEVEIAICIDCFIFGAVSQWQRLLVSATTIIFRPNYSTLALNSISPGRRHSLGRLLSGQR